MISDATAAPVVVGGGGARRLNLRASSPRLRGTMMPAACLTIVRPILLPRVHKKKSLSEVGLGGLGVVLTVFFLAGGGGSSGSDPSSSSSDSDSEGPGAVSLYMRRSSASLSSASDGRIVTDDLRGGIDGVKRAGSGIDGGGGGNGVIGVLAMRWRT